MTVCSSSECEKCHGQGGRYDDEVQDQWYWCDNCDAGQKHYEQKRIASLASEDWIKERWGGFTYLVIGRNEDFMLDMKDGSLFLHYENDTRNCTVGRLLIMESATKQCVVEAEKLLGCR